MSRLTRDGTAESASGDQILRRERDREILFFPVQLTTSRISNLTRLILTLAICDDHTRRLLWSGALLRMGNYRLPKMIISGELGNAGRGPGGTIGCAAS